MKYVLFATAGHVDHGKTTLIRTLTGIDTDRLPEEKRRGLSIDIGFAYIDFPDVDLRVEIIDVPGHERFIKNAIAGLSSAEGLILVVDATEGVMDQTVEHLRVARSLGLERGVAVITKVDRADTDLIRIAEEEVRDLLREEGTDLPVVRFSAKTGEGADLLRERIKEAGLEVLKLREERPLRILVDSAFTVRGHGTVLRGSCVEGYVEEGERVVVEPLGVEARVRRIQNHGEFVRRAEAGERVALNLPEVDGDTVERGFWVLKPNTYRTSRVLIVKTDAKVKPSHLHYLFFGMREVRGRLSPVEEDVYILRTEEPVVARRGDRVVILSSEGRFLGGGEVLHPAVRTAKKSFIRENLRDLLESFEAYLLRESGSEGVKPSTIKKLTGKDPDQKVLTEMGVKVGDRFYSREYVEDLVRRVSRFLEEKKSPWGVGKDLLKERFGITEEMAVYVIQRTGRYRIVENLILDESGTDLTALPQFRRLMEILEGSIREEREVLGEGVPKEILSLAVRKRYVHRIGDYLLLSDGLLKDMVKKLKSLGSSFTVQDAKACLGLTRKYLIPFLEYLDYLGLTSREGNIRRWRR
ncbi:MAG: selenocysteine-specific translation elongation factor [Aquificota bacterium]|nr:selenocysteine-specific translation elongation factor [Aquificota bacterium]